MEQMLPTNREELAARGWRGVDIVLITGDAYFDHPSHGVAVVGRFLESAGYRVGIIARPRWRSTADFRSLGRPALFAGISGGAVDTLVNNYTADLAKRSDDAYAPGGVGGGRPDFATLVYANRMREAYPGLPLVLGGIEASLRMFAYFDPLKNQIRRSILVDSRADILVYGPGEKQALEIADRLAAGRELSNIDGTARLLGRDVVADDCQELPSFDELRAERSGLVAAALQLERSGAPFQRLRFAQRYDEGMVVAEPRARQTTEDLDRIFALPFCRQPHPSYTSPIPALETVRWSVISHRGCPGGCSFCALALHQGREVVSRSAEAVLDEIRDLGRLADFKGTISDVGGPTANTYLARQGKASSCKKCVRPSCLYPRPCPHLVLRQTEYLSLLERARSASGIKRVYVASGIRHDLALGELDFIKQLAEHHTGGHLKVAPEHVDARVLALMRKPSIELFEEFERLFFRASGDRKQYLVPYFIAGFPGCNRQEADRVGRWLDGRRQTLRQVQNFIPIAGTAAAAMYAAGLDFKGNEIYVADKAERRRQKQLLTRGRSVNDRPRRSQVPGLRGARKKSERRLK